ncbi:VOC family protein [Paraglaciecola sp. L1A13]|uniref:VOC family protein n=1 Tax=Paraglaciecola sp. L1A13 TaxID=2686359 RepID=UPI00131D6EA1|nr:VOC family protein [Paraglaciecola sp. L1A13]
MNHIRSIHHINYLVSDLNQAIPYFSKLFNCQPIVEALSGRDVKTARFPVGDAWLVLVQPVSEHSEVARILAQRGEGLFLLSFGVDNLSNALDALVERGIKPDAKGPRSGLDNWSVHDIECPLSLAFVLQLCQPT